MKKLQHTLLAAGAAVAFALIAQPATAQERQRGNFDPEQMRQRMMERYREALEIKSDDEWKLIEGRITKVTDAQRDARSGFGFGAFGRGGGGRRGGDGNNSGNNNGGGDTRRRFGGEPSAEADALQKALEAKASNEEIKTKLAKFRESQKEKQTKVETAQAELRKVLSVRQEATAVTMGLLP
jgi:hypothetical protein